MPKERPRDSMPLPQERLSQDEIIKLLKKYPGVKMDEGNQHFMVEIKDEAGKWVKTEFVPPWENIPQKGGGAVSPEKEIRKALGLKPEEDDNDRPDK